MKVEDFRKIKEEKGYSLADLSKMSGVPAATLQKIFDGTTRHPRRNTIEALENAFSAALSKPEVLRYVREAAQETSAMLLNEPSPAIGIAKTSVPGNVNDPTEETGWKQLLLPRKQGEYTIEDYDKIPDDQRVELIDGVIYDMSAPTINHQAASGEIYTQISLQIRENGGGCLPYYAPVDVKLGEDNRTMVQPDVIILCDRDKRRRWGIDGAPDFLLEILSPSTLKKDMIIKFRKYKECGVKEYWMLDVEEKVLFMYDFRRESTLPFRISPLTGKAGLAIYDGQIQVDLDEVARAIADDLPE